MRFSLCAVAELKEMGIAGIPWWTTDIGGFFGANINDPAFHGAAHPLVPVWLLLPRHGGVLCVPGAVPV